MLGLKAALLPKAITPLSVKCPIYNRLLYEIEVEPSLQEQPLQYVVCLVSGSVCGLGGVPHKYCSRGTVVCAVR